MDNLFVFLVIMTTFAVPAEHQQRVLTFGILLALALRAVFIALGAALLSAFSFMFLVFGLLLIATAIQLFRHRDEDPSVEDNAVVAFARRRLPFTESFVGGKLVTRENGRRLFTPLFLVLIAIGTVDVLFALDSIPAIFGVTEEAYIVFAANAFALLGLRALFFLVSGLLDRLVYLSTGLALILLFIGAKLVLHFLHDQDSGDPRDLDRSLARGDRLDPGDRDDRKHLQGATRPRRPRSCWLTPRARGRERRADPSERQLIARTPAQGPASPSRPQVGDGQSAAAIEGQFARARRGRKSESYSRSASAIGWAGRRTISTEQGA